VRCPRCGNENSDGNRFCGMCGASLLPAPVPKAAAPPPVPVAASPTAEVVAEPARARPRPVAESSPSISGPSFLGLNDPARSNPAPRKRASLSIDPKSTAGSNLDYLLDEEEPEHHWGIGKILLILIALALAVGFGYLRFKNQGLAWLNEVRKPTAVAQNSSTPDTTAAPGSSPSITPDPQPPAQPTAAPPPQPTTATPANAPSGNGVAPGPETTNPATPAPADTSKATDTSKPADAAPPVANADKAASPTEKDSSTANDGSTDTPAPTTKPTESPKPAPKAPAPKPSAASRPAPAYDPVSEAQKYLYGRGAVHDCDRGLRLLRPAANQANPKAMIEMGALYSAGLCTPRDLPTAYRWFALALRKDPENTAVQTDLQKLWGEMTQPERQLAIKLTQ
jgi:hypothetical protein